MVSGEGVARPEPDFVWTPPWAENSGNLAQRGQVEPEASGLASHQPVANLNPYAIATRLAAAVYGITLKAGRDRKNW